jgi:hypothetical protein
VIPTCSRRDSENSLKLGSVFTTLHAIGKNSKDKSFDFGNGFDPARPIGHGTRKSRHFSNPTPIILDVYFNQHTIPLALTCLKRKPGP